MNTLSAFNNTLADFKRWNQKVETNGVFMPAAWAFSFSMWVGSNYFSQGFLVDQTHLSVALERLKKEHHDLNAYRFVKESVRSKELLAALIADLASGKEVQRWDLDQLEDTIATMKQLKEGHPFEGGRLSCGAHVFPYRINKWVCNSKDSLDRIEEAFSTGVERFKEAWLTQWGISNEHAIDLNPRQIRHLGLESFSPLMHDTMTPVIEKMTADREKRMLHESVMISPIDQGNNGGSPPKKSML